MTQKLTGIPETMLIPLWARAVESEQEKPIIQDTKAVEMLSRIDYDFSKFEKAWLSQVGVSIRTMLLDNETLAFVRRNPGAVIVNLGSGLDTRYERLEDEGISFWYDLDLPDAIKLRQMFFTESEKNKFIAKSAFDLSWMEDIDCTSKPVLIIAEGLLMYFSEAEVRWLFRQIASHLTGAEMLFEMLAPFLVGRSKHHESVKKLESAAEFKWGLKDSREIESWDEHIRFVEEWDYFDYHKNRWKWFGYFGRFPLIRPMFSNRIVHLKFS
ncbi:methyltransferase [candidate division KSB3 bacterium]|uniref:Methyltransferase n=1 Tax=candidate division KSB3 bacterium TaxID=2044937 RepID=A0A2G6KKW0_9BACT|nr:MAG: methyltransferase [candidate division KSB3 bacterium]